MTTDDVKFPDGDAYPNWTFPVAIGFGAPFFFLDLLGNNLLGMLAAMSAAAVAVVFITLRKWRARLSFWIAIALNAVVHCFLVHWITLGHSDSHFPGITLAPLLIVDIVFWQYVSVVCMKVLRV
jgi:hypothetical protein